MLERPKFLQGLFAFSGVGLETPIPFQPPIIYQVPADRRAQLVYFRAGNPAPELIFLVMMRNGSPMRYFAVGAKDGIHISLAVVEDLLPETLLEVHVAAPAAMASAVMLDIGLMEI